MAATIEEDHSTDHLRDMTARRLSDFTGARLVIKGRVATNRELDQFVLSERGSRRANDGPALTRYDRSGR